MGNTFNSERTNEFNRLCQNILHIHPIVFQNFTGIDKSLDMNVNTLNQINSVCFRYWIDLVRKIRQDYIDILGEVNNINNNYNKLLPFTNDEYQNYSSILNQIHDINKIMNTTLIFLTSNIETINNSNWVLYEQRSGFTPIDSSI